jgi:hypothetical protein
MARALGMNPKKLPSLRPSPDQRWKLPVSEFIESCYCKRFGGDPLEHPRLDPESQSSKRTVPKPDLDTSKRSRDTMLQLEIWSFTSPIWSPIWRHGWSTAPSRRTCWRN